MRERRKDHFGIGKKNQRRRKEKGTCGKEEESRKVGGNFLLGPNRWGEKGKGGKENKEKRKGKKGKENEGKQTKESRALEGEEKERISRRSDSQSSTVQELKLVHAMIATHGYQNQSVSSYFKR